MTKSVLRTMGNWILRLVLLSFLFVAAVIVYALVRESVARERYQQQFPPPGDMIQVGAYSIHLNCLGTGRPTVVFESDLDAIASLSWSLVQPKVAEITRACTYDRAGILWSESGSRPRNGDQIAGELGELLTAAGEQGPFVLVGHAMGGAYIRIFAGQSPESICGLVLVDSAHPDQTARFADIGIESERPTDAMRPLVTLLSHLGMPRRYSGPRPRTMPQRDYDIQQAYLPFSSVAWFDETVEGERTLEQAGKVDHLGSLPLVVLSSARPSGISAQNDGQDLQDLWLEMQEGLAQLSTEGELRAFEGSGHYIQYDRPEAVIEAIRDVIHACPALP
jgi:pimeloyl-ACP methyl ester carboxylesterase